MASYALAPTIVGTSQVGRLPATDIDVAPGTIIENLHFGGMAHAEATYRRKFGAVVDIAYMKLGAATDTPLTGGRVRSSVKQLNVETLLSYRAFDSGSSSVEVYTGGRYWDIDINFNATGTIAGSFNVNRGDRWFDPVIGLRGTHYFNDKWSVRARADIGGFGIGSDFTWLFQGGVGYDFNETWSAHLQYKALSVDYDNEKSGIGRFAYDTITHGPLLGIAARF